MKNKYGTIMASTLTKNAVQTGIGTATDILQVSTGYRVTVIGCNIANTTSQSIVVSIRVVGADSTLVYYLKEVPVPPSTSLKVITNDEKLVLEANTSLQIESDVANSADVVLSYVESADPSIIDTNGFVISTNPTNGQLLEATSNTTATWINPVFKLVTGDTVSITVPTTPVLGQVLTLTSATDAQWKDPVLPEGFPGGGTVTSVGGTGTVNGLTLTGSITSSGNLTLGGTLSNINLASQVTGVLPLVNGGTGANSSTGTGSIVLSDSPTLVTPVLGTPASGNLANCTFPTLNQNTTGTAGGITGILAVTSGGTGVTTSTGTGNIVLSNSPTLVAPILGTPVSGNLSNCTFPVLNQNTTGTASGITGILTIAHGGTGVNQATGTGKVVLSNNPVFVNPTLGTPASGTLTNCTGLPLTGVTGILITANGGTGTTTATGSGDNVLSTSPVLTSPTLIAPLLGVPTSGVLTNCTGLPYSGLTGTVPTWNQNTSGTAAGLSATLAVTSGGTGVTTSTGTGNVVLSTSPTLVTPILGTPASGNFSTGTFTWPTFNQSTSGNAANITGTLAVLQGGTGATANTGSGNNVLASSPTLTSPTLTNPTISSYVESVVAIGTVTTSATIDLTNGTVQTATLSASTACVFTMPTLVAGKSFILLLKQAAGGGGTASFTNVKWGTTGAPTITATASKLDLLTFVSDGTNWYGSISQGYTP